MSTDSYSQLDRAAVVLCSLPDDRAEDVLGRIAPDLAADLRSKRAEWRTDGRADQIQDGVLEEFEEFLREQVASSPPDTDDIAPLEDELPNQKAPENSEPDCITIPIDPAHSRSETSDSTSSWEVDSSYDTLELTPEQLLSLAGRLSPEQIACVLLELPQSTATLLFAACGEDIQPEVVKRLVDFDEVSSDCEVASIREMLKAIAAEEDVGEGLPPSKGTVLLTAMIRESAADDRNRLMGDLQSLAPHAFSKVADSFYDFTSISQLNPHSLSVLLKHVDLRVLAIALKSVSPTILDAIISRLPPRDRALFEDEQAFAAAASSASVEEARREITSHLITCDQAGLLQWTTEETTSQAS